MRFAALLGADMQLVKEGLHVAEGLDAVAVNMEAILHRHQKVIAVEA